VAIGLFAGRTIYEPHSFIAAGFDLTGAGQRALRELAHEKEAAAA
jgi:hypothetical protein